MKWRQTKEQNYVFQYIPTFVEEIKIVVGIWYTIKTHEISYINENALVLSVLQWVKNKFLFSFIIQVTYELHPLIIFFQNLIWLSFPPGTCSCLLITCTDISSLGLKTKHIHDRVKKETACDHAREIHYCICFSDSLFRLVSRTIILTVKFTKYLIQHDPAA